MGRKQLVAVIVLLVAVAVAVAVAAAASRGGGNAHQTKPNTPAMRSNGLGDDDANVMRRLQRDKLVRSHK